MKLWQSVKLKKEYFFIVHKTKKSINLIKINLCFLIEDKENSDLKSHFDCTYRHNADEIESQMILRGMQICRWWNPEDICDSTKILEKGHWFTSPLHLLARVISVKRIWKIIFTCPHHYKVTKNFFNIVRFSEILMFKNLPQWKILVNIMPACFRIQDPRIQQVNC